MAGAADRFVAIHEKAVRAPDLALSANTVAAHRANIMAALGVHKTAELVAGAVRNGMASIP